jgi:DNA segregation ATPase FtsK/SpoIIIE-like protein
LEKVEEGFSEVQEVEDFTEGQKETTELVQGHSEELADTIRGAEEKIRQATDEAVERLPGKPEYPSALRDAIERIEDALDALGSRPSGGVVWAKPREEEEEEEEEEVEAIYETAREFVVAEQKASTSLLQRRFRIGYGKAAMLMDMLEEQGVVEPSDGTNRPRKLVE